MSGSILSAWIDGTTYNVKADADFTENSGREIEGVRHSGGTLYKTALQVATVEGIDLIVDSVEKLTIRDIINNGDIIAFGYKEEDGAVNNNTGKINNAGRTTQENTMAIVMIPDNDWDITPP